MYPYRKMLEWIYLGGGGQVEPPEFKKYVWVIDQARGQDGWILAKFLFCVFMDRDEVEVHKLAKKRTRPISSHLDRTNLVNKGFIIWLLVKFFLRDTAGSPKCSILPTRVANHSARFGLSCPLTELAI